MIFAEKYYGLDKKCIVLQIFHADYCIYRAVCNFNTTIICFTNH